MLLVYLPGYLDFRLLGMGVCLPAGSSIARGLLSLPDASSTSRGWPWQRGSDGSWGKPG